MRYPQTLAAAGRPGRYAPPGSVIGRWSAKSQQPFSPHWGSPRECPGPACRRHGPEAPVRARCRRPARSRCRSSSSPATAGATASASRSTAPTATRCTAGRWDKIVAHYYPGTTLGQAPREEGARAARARREARGDLVALGVHRRDGAGKSHKLAAGVQRARAGPEAAARRRPSAEGAAGPARRSRPGRAPLSLGGRAYRGSLRVQVVGSALQIVNVVGLESYLRGVVAVARCPTAGRPRRSRRRRSSPAPTRSRTGRRRRLRPLPGHAQPGLRRHRRRVAERHGRRRPRPRARSCSTTASRPDTYFSSSSGGQTANVQDVWPSSTPMPYLVSVKDPYDTLSPYHDWGPLRFGAPKLARRLGVPGSIARLPRERQRVRPRADADAHRDEGRDRRSAARSVRVAARPALDVVPPRAR